MTTDNGLPPPDYARSDAPEHKHQRELLSCLQVSRPVMVEGKVQFIAALGVQPVAGKIEMLVYIAGKSEPVSPEAVTIHDIPE